MASKKRNFFGSSVSADNADTDPADKSGLKTVGAAEGYQQAPDSLATFEAVLSPNNVFTDRSFAEWRNAPDRMRRIEGNPLNDLRNALDIDLRKFSRTEEIIDVLIKAHRKALSALEGTGFYFREPPKEAKRLKKARRKLIEAHLSKLAVFGGVSEVFNKYLERGKVFESDEATAIKHTMPGPVKAPENLFDPNRKLKGETAVVEFSFKRFLWDRYFVNEADVNGEQTDNISVTSRPAIIPEPSDEAMAETERLGKISNESEAARIFDRVFSELFETHFNEYLEKANFNVDEAFANICRTASTKVERTAQNVAGNSLRKLSDFVEDTVRERRKKIKARKEAEAKGKKLHAVEDLQELKIIDVYMNLGERVMRRKAAEVREGMLAFIEKDLRGNFMLTKILKTPHMTYEEATAEAAHDLLFKLRDYVTKGEFKDNKRAQWLAYYFSKYGQNEQPNLYYEFYEIVKRRCEDYVQKIDPESTGTIPVSSFLADKVAETAEREKEPTVTVTSKAISTRARMASAPEIEVEPLTDPSPVLKSGTGDSASASDAGASRDSDSKDEITITKVVPVGRAPAIPMDFNEDEEDTKKMPRGEVEAFKKMSTAGKAKRRPAPRKPAAKQIKKPADSVKKKLSGDEKRALDKEVASIKPRWEAGKEEVVSAGALIVAEGVKAVQQAADEVVSSVASAAAAPQAPVKIEEPQDKADEEVTIPEPDKTPPEGTPYRAAPPKPKVVSGLGGATVEAAEAQGSWSRFKNWAGEKLSNAWSWAKRNKKPLIFAGAAAGTVGAAVYLKKDSVSDVDTTTATASATASAAPSATTAKVPAPAPTPTATPPTKPDPWTDDEPVTSPQPDVKKDLDVESKKDVLGKEIEIDMSKIRPGSELEKMVKTGKVELRGSDRGVIRRFKQVIREGLVAPMSVEQREKFNEITRKIDKYSGVVFRQKFMALTAQERAKIRRDASHPLHTELTDTEKILRSNVENIGQYKSITSDGVEYGEKLYAELREAGIERRGSIHSPAPGRKDVKLDEKRHMTFVADYMVAAGVAKEAVEDGSVDTVFGPRSVPTNYAPSAPKKIDVPDDKNNKGGVPGKGSFILPGLPNEQKWNPVNGRGNGLAPSRYASNKPNPPKSVVPDTSEIDSGWDVEPKEVEVKKAEPKKAATINMDHIRKGAAKYSEQFVSPIKAEDPLYAMRLPAMYRLGKGETFWKTFEANLESCAMSDVEKNAVRDVVAKWKEKSANDKPFSVKSFDMKTGYKTLTLFGEKPQSKAFLEDLRNAVIAA